MLISGGHWDNTVKIVPVDHPTHVQSLFGHKDKITCLCLTEDGKFLVTGSDDTTVLVWHMIIGIILSGRTSLI